MLKKLLFIGLLISILINFNYVSAETSLIVPIQKPSLTEKEIKKKISKNILKPIKKQKKTQNIEIKEKKIIEVKEIKKDKKLSFKIPKKKPSIAFFAIFSDDVHLLFCISDIAFLAILKSFLL